MPSSIGSVSALLRSATISIFAHWQLHSHDALRTGFDSAMADTWAVERTSAVLIYDSCHRELSRSGAGVEKPLRRPDLQRASNTIVQLARNWRGLSTRVSGLHSHKGGPAALRLISFERELSRLVR